MEDSFSLIAEKADAVLGFAMGYFKQYDDIVGYVLEEIIIAHEYQNQGIGSAFLGNWSGRERESCLHGTAGCKG